MQRKKFSNLAIFFSSKRKMKTYIHKKLVGEYVWHV